MKKTLNIGDGLLKEAKVACGASTDTEAVRLGLEALVRHAAYERLRAFCGTEPHARNTPTTERGLQQSAESPDGLRRHLCIAIFLEKSGSFALDVFSEQPKLWQK